MNSKVWIRKALSMCLTVAIIATYSMVAFAGTEKVAGELLVSGKNVVTVNGEAAQNGRSIFSSSTIATPADASAIINLGKIGKIELAPDTTLSLSFSEKGISGDLISGRVTVLNASHAVSIKTAEGKVLSLNVGESALSNASSNNAAQTGGGHSWWVWGLVFGGAIAGIVFVATQDSNRVALGGGTTVVSPTR
ncbi:MAG: hypothetical protein WA584_14025 [Pyrinomonadaceae bacterium]